ncbi:MAG: CoxG family protein [Janthinobacterium lividum]
MAMEMKGEVTLPADRATVWAKLNDPDVLKACINGVQSMERTGDNTFTASVKMKIGPVSATFKGQVELTNIDPPNGYRISGAGEGGIAGFAKGGADVTLTEVPEGTLLRYDVQANVGGKIAQMGARLIDGVAKKTADQFFASFAAECADAEAGGTRNAEAAVPAA